MKREYLDPDDDDCVKDGETTSCPIFCMDSTRGRMVAGLDYQHAYSNYCADAGLPEHPRASADADLADHQPGFRYATDDARKQVRDARDQMVRRAENAWRLDARRKKPNNDDDDDGDGDDDYEVMGSEGQPKTDPRKIGQSSLDACSIVDARQRVRDAYFEMVRRAERAWMTPGRDAAEPSNSSPPEVMRKFLRGGSDDDHDVDAAMARHQRQRDDAWAKFRDDLQHKWRTGRTDPNAASRVERAREEYLGKFER